MPGPFTDHLGYSNAQDKQDLCFCGFYLLVGGKETKI